MQRPGDIDEVEPCDICGDVGYPEVIATCSKCHITREHAYCMRVYLKEVPEDWLCEFCQSGHDAISLKSGENKNISRVHRSDVSKVICNDFVDVSLKSGCHAYAKRQKPVTTGKVKFIPEEEVVKLSLGNFASKPVPANSTMPVTKISAVSKSVTPKNPPLMVKPNPSMATIGHGNGMLNRHSGVQKSLMIDEKSPLASLKVVPASEQKAAVTLAKECHHSEQSPGSIRPVNRVTSRAIIGKASDKLPRSTAVGSRLITSMGGTSLVVNECNRSDVEERDLQTFKTNLKIYHSYFPALQSAWRGGFKILQTAAPFEFYGGFQALPPCTVHRKAYEFSCKMPSILEVEQVPASLLLSDLFGNDNPDLQDVALYFFPSDNIELLRENLNIVFELMDGKNLMLRGVIDGVELLVFTSKQLNKESWGTVARVNAGYFLWGVFRQVKKEKGTERLPETEIDVVDMEIDMFGGKDVGKIDNVVRDKNSSLSTVLRNKIKTGVSSDLPFVKENSNTLDKLDVPPGFETKWGDNPFKTAVQKKKVPLSGERAAATKFNDVQPPKFKKVNDCY